MPSTTIEANELCVHLSTMEKLLAVSRDFTVPLQCVRAIAVGPPPRRGFKIAYRVGTSLPGVISAGTFTVDRQRSFWYVKGSPTCLIVELAGHRLDRIVLAVDDPEAAAQEIATATGLEPARVANSD